MGGRAVLLVEIEVIAVLVVPPAQVQQTSFAVNPWFAYK
jgi:hypothetical protein